MTERFQNLRMTMLALVFLLAIGGSVYVASYFYFGSRSDDLNRMGQSIEVTRRYRWPLMAAVFQPLGQVEALVTQRPVVIKYVNGALRPERMHEPFVQVDSIVHADEPGVDLP